MQFRGKRKLSPRDIDRAGIGGHVSRLPINSRHHIPYDDVLERGGQAKQEAQVRRQARALPIRDDDQDQEEEQESRRAAWMSSSSSQASPLRSSRITSWTSCCQRYSGSAHGPSTSSSSTTGRRLTKQASDLWKRNSLRSNPGLPGISSPLTHPTPTSTTCASSIPSRPPSRRRGRMGGAFSSLTSRCSGCTAHGITTPSSPNCGSSRPPWPGRSLWPTYVFINNPSAQKTQRRNLFEQKLQCRLAFWFKNRIGGRADKTVSSQSSNTLTNNRKGQNKNFSVCQICVWRVSRIIVHRSGVCTDFDPPFVIYTSGTSDSPSQR